MKNLFILLAIPLFFISCIRDNDGSEQNNLVSFDVSMSIPSFGVFGTDKSTSSQVSKSSSFEHIFKDEIDVVFTSTTSDFTTTLTITPNDLSSTPSIELPYGTYSWTITTENDFSTDLEYSFPDFLPVYGTGTLEVFSSNISLDLIVDTNYGLVTVQRENIAKATITLYETTSKQLTLLDNLYYTYAYQQDAIKITIEESRYGSTITEPAQGGKQILAKTHYNYILAFSDVDINSITLRTAAFEQIDYYLQPTGTVSSTCSLSLSPYQSQSYLTQAVSATSSIQTVTFSTSTTCSETINYSVSGLPAGVSMDIIELTYPRISGTVSSSVASGTYNYTITAFNSTLSSTATVSATATGTIIVTNTSTETNSQSSYNYSTVQIGDQVWFSENLKEIRYQNGDPITNIEDDETWNSTSLAAYSYFSNDSNNIVLYNWAAASNNKNICPQGFRVPNREDFETLFSYVKGDGSYDDLYERLASGGSSGFNANEFQYRGGGGNNGAFLQSNNSQYWTSSSRITDSGRVEYFVVMTPGNVQVNTINLNVQNYGYCVRCIQN